MPKGIPEAPGTKRLALQVPIGDLSNRIRWDAEFARGEFELGCFDRLGNRIVHVAFREADSPRTTRTDSGWWTLSGLSTRCQRTASGRFSRTVNGSGTGPTPHENKARRW